MTIRVYAKGKFRYYSSMDSLLNDLSGEEISQSLISISYHGEILGYLDSEKIRGFLYEDQGIR